RASCQPVNGPAIRRQGAGGLLGLPVVEVLMDAQPTVASRATALGSGARRSRNERRRAEHLPGAARRVAYLYVLPAFALYAAFNLVPLFQGVNMSLYDWDGITPGTWVGLRNYEGFFSDPAVRTGYSHVLILMIFYAFLPIAI